MGMRRTHHHGMSSVCNRDIGDITPGAADQRIVLLARQRLTDTKFHRIRGLAFPMRGGSFGFAAALESVLQAAHHNIESGRENQPENRDADHAEHHRGAERLPEFSAGADRNRKRQHAEDEGERSHQDRAQPQARPLPPRPDSGPCPGLRVAWRIPRSGLRSSAARPISTMNPTCVRMLLSMPRKTTPVIEAIRHIGTIRMTASGSVRLSYCAASTRNTNTTASREGEHRGVAGLDLLVGQRRPFIGEAVGQRFGGELLHDLDRLPLRIARRRRAIEFGRRIDVVARHAVRVR